MRLALAFLCLAAPAWAQEYQPEAEPLPSPELVMRSFGFVMLDPLPVADPGQPVTVDFFCARLVGATDQCTNGIARLQSTLTNSNQGHITVRLLEKFQSTYKSDGNGLNDLSRVSRPVDGFADDIMARREAIGADCVVVLTTARDVCGIAYLIAGPTSCVAVVADNCLSNFSFEHEGSHNAGLAHDQPNDSSGGGYNGTSWGYCAVHPANGANAWRFRAPVMAAFRQPLTLPPPPQPTGKPSVL